MTPTKALEKIGIHSHHGIDIPLLSIRTQNSSGNGEFLDLLLLMDWCEEVGFDLIQLLPLNDTGLISSPYSPLSSCALHPIYISLKALPHLDSELEKRLGVFDQYKKTPRVLYEDVYGQKLIWLRLYFEKKGILFLQSQEYQEFVKEHSWVFSYGLFRTLQNNFPGKKPKEWLIDPKNPDPLFLSQHHEEISFFIFLQFLAFKQLKQVKAYAKSKQLLLMGDQPILIHPESVDVWQEPELFDQTLEAGAPPDQYAALGQNWGFPILRFDLYPEKGISWWQRRLKVSSEFYDLYRIDHVVGLYRIWAIPKGKSGKQGAFLPKDPKTWIPGGEALLKSFLLECPLLPIAEDLGTIPDEVRASLMKLGIPGTKVMRWEREWKTTKKFIEAKDYPTLSLTCVSTHDSPTLSQWWKEFPQEAKVYAAQYQWVYKKQLSFEERFFILKESHTTPSLFHVNLLQEYLAFFKELSWPNMDAERINVPGSNASSNWTYRFLPSLEELTSHAPLKKVISELLKTYY